ncbi:hypothetical protein BN938_0926 [Mucinivorans hirudinis]|uniref:TonB C-terminal domain-containing protein n=1 Tax=Mucinivorans hirudinis TaxID=1433126 RepID=A0A060R779_9BACT|nr:hypothetical protein BN938_0926 [Mucinivorans hirudinis]
MKRVIIITILACLPLALFSQRGSRSLGRKFSPIYGSDADINRTLTFISENFAFDSLTYSRLANLKGYVHCRFFVEKDGSVVDIQIARGLAYWIDYEIIAGMKALPKMEPFKDRAGGALKVRREVFFTFNNSEEDRFSKLPNYSDHQQQDPEIERQRKEQIEKGIAQNKAWDKFMEENAKLSLDGKSIYKPGTLPNNPLKITPPPTRPPIKVTIKAE